MTVLAAGDLLAVVRYEQPAGHDFTIERVTAIAVPAAADADIHTTAYFIDGTGWATRTTPFANVLAVAAPANIVAVSGHCLHIWRHELGNLEGLAPWITPGQLDQWLEAWADKKTDHR